jgi:hypothetical protein
LEGWWWIDNKDFTHSIPEMSMLNLDKGTSFTWKRAEDETIPKWASEFHSTVSKLGSVEDAIKMFRSKSIKYSKQSVTLHDED